MCPLSQEQMDSLATQLAEAMYSKKFITPLTESFPEMTIDEAYKIQLRVAEKRWMKGESVAGIKVAFTNKAVQSNLGVSEPAFGHIMNTMMLFENDPIVTSELPQIIIEAEIGIVLGETLKGPGVTVASALKCIRGAVPAIEVAGGRYSRRGKVQDTIADLAGGSHMILGGKITSIEGLDLRLLGVVVEKNGEVIAAGTGVSALGNPVHVMAWLANKMSEYGLELTPGQFVITGSLIPAAPAQAGDRFKVTFDRLGSVSTRFV